MEFKLHKRNRNTKEPKSNYYGSSNNYSGIRRKVIRNSRAWFWNNNLRNYGSNLRNYRRRKEINSSKESTSMKLFEIKNKPAPWLLVESKEGKNVHLEHLEDEIFNLGYAGAVQVLDYLDNLQDEEEENKERIERCNEFRKMVYNEIITLFNDNKKIVLDTYKKQKINVKD